MIEIKPCVSEQVWGYGYNEKTQTLALQFVSRKGGQRGPGSVYHYANVTPLMFGALEATPSVGKWFAAILKNRADEFPYTKQPETEQSE